MSSPAPAAGPLPPEVVQPPYDHVPAHSRLVNSTIMPPSPSPAIAPVPLSPSPLPSSPSPLISPSPSAFPSSPSPVMPLSPFPSPPSPESTPPAISPFPSPVFPPSPTPFSDGSTPTNPLPPLPSSSPISPPDSSVISTSLVLGVTFSGLLILLFFLLLLFYLNKKGRGSSSLAKFISPAHKPSDQAIPIKPEPYPLSAVSNSISLLPHPPPHLFESSVSIYSVPEIMFQPSFHGVALDFSNGVFTYEELVTATDGFSDGNLLGEGGFGCVYRGILWNGKEVAVKKLRAGGVQREREFRTEVEIISRVHHKHLVSLVGYCIMGNERILVYEFVPNNTLEFHLHEKGRPVIDWQTRMRIAIGSAKGLTYLHEDCHAKIIHRDIKASNILLDFNFEPKVADFGLAKFSSDSNSHISTRVMGTFGYMAPEYALNGKLTDKSDVFSFGVVLLELITGFPPISNSEVFNDVSLVDWARPLLTRALEEGNFDDLINPQLRNNYDHDEMARMVACAAACVRNSANRRPSLSQVLRTLQGDVSFRLLNEGVEPMESSSWGLDFDSSRYIEGMKRLRKIALESQEYTTMDMIYNNTASESILNPSRSSSDLRQSIENISSQRTYTKFLM